MITVFTPTYNRKELLKRCYDSLLKQTNTNFIWLIVDDGSTDGTEDYINSIKIKSPFKIEYFYQPNGGKHRAHNKGVKMCHTEFFLILDSDDMLTKNCIERLNFYLKKIENEDFCSGIIGYRGDINTKKNIGKKLPKIAYATGIELYQKYNFDGDTLRLYKTNVLKENLFPEIAGENFISENVVFDKIDQKYKMYIIHDILYLCEYQQDGYSKNINKVRYNNPIGYALSLKSSAETAVKINKKINYTILYILWCQNLKIPGLNKYKYKSLYLILYPVAEIFNLIKFPKFFYDNLKEGEESGK